MRTLLIAALICGWASVNAASSDLAHSHPPPDKLGAVRFDTSCAEAVQGQFDHAMALLHSFAYDSAAREFQAVAARDASCAIAHWGVAMSAFPQLWSPPGARELDLGREELLAARRGDIRTERERELIAAAAVYFSDSDPAHHATRLQE